MQFTYGAEASLKRRKRQDGSTEYTVVARHNPITGRIEAETGEEPAQEPLYKECLSWCNPVEFEKYLEQVMLQLACSGMPASLKTWFCVKAHFVMTALQTGRLLLTSPRGLLLAFIKLITHVCMTMVHIGCAVHPNISCPLPCREQSKKVGHPKTGRC